MGSIGMVNPPYIHTRFVWGLPIDLSEIEKELEGKFEIKMITMPRDDTHEISLFKNVRDELQVTADTLKARISGLRATLYQKESAPFTERDLELRKIIFERYPYNTSSPFTGWLRSEPKFEIKQ